MGYDMILMIDLDGVVKLMVVVKIVGVKCYVIISVEFILDWSCWL